MKYFKNPIFHSIVLGFTFGFMAVEVFVFGKNDLESMSIAGKICGWIFLVDLMAWAVYVVILKMIFKVK